MDIHDMEWHPVDLGYKKYKSCIFFVQQGPYKNIQSIYFSFQLQGFLSDTLGYIQLILKSKGFDIIYKEALFTKC